MRTFTITCCGILIGVLVAFTPVSRAETLPDKVTIDSLKNLYSPVTFNHAQHIVREKDCAVCHHHTNGAPASNERCIRCHRGGHEVKSMGCKSCHENNPFSAESVNQKFVNNQLFHQDKPGLKASYHLSCLGCHKIKGGPVLCADCHAVTDNGDSFYRSGQYAPDPKKAGKSGH
jgi:hypothetical protein